MYSLHCVCLLVSITVEVLLPHSLCERYGECLGECGGRVVHSFPPPEVLVGEKSEGVLREMGFGYRASYVVGSVREVVRRGGEEWLRGLQQRPYPEAWEELQQLPGVGAKVSHHLSGCYGNTAPAHRWRTVCV